MNKVYLFLTVALLLYLVSNTFMKSEAFNVAFMYEYGRFLWIFF